MSLVILFLVSLTTASIAQVPFSPLSTFYDIDVSTSASFFGGKSFGPGCARGGSIPDGFIAVAMNGATLGMRSPAASCGMCLAIKGPAPSSSDPAQNQGVVGEYYAYVYEVCEECSQSAGLQLGIPGSGQSNVIWRAIPCPIKAESSVSIFFDGATINAARFQIRGLSAPIVSAVVNGKDVITDGPIFVVQNSTCVYPFTIDVVTALNEQVSVTIPAFREHGMLSDLITVNKKADARATASSAPVAISQYGSGEITTVAGGQTRTVKTSNQAGRQVVTIVNSPNEQAEIAKQALEQQVSQRTTFPQQMMPQQQQLPQIHGDVYNGASGGRWAPVYAAPDAEQFAHAADILSSTVPLGVNDFTSSKFEEVQMSPVDGTYTRAAF